VTLSKIKNTTPTLHPTSIDSEANIIIEKHKFNKLESENLKLNKPDIISRIIKKYYELDPNLNIWDH